MRRIGVLTGGGDCPGLNAVIRAVVKTAVGDYGWEVLGVEDSFEGLFRNGRMRPLSPSDVRGILPRGGTILGTTNRSNPFALPVLEGDRVVVKDVSREVLARICQCMDALVVIGGDGTLHIAHELHRMGAPIVGVPKTIDNDLSATDVTFGFDTALHTATEAIDKLHTTAESHHRVMVVEVMGRNAGWIALESGLAGGADVILIPEIPYNVDLVGKKVREREWLGSRFSIVVVAEGARPVDGEVTTLGPAAEPGVVRLGGVGNKVAAQIAELTGLETRCTVLGHLQRGGMPSPFDRVLGTRFGAAAVRQIADGALGTMVALHGTHIEPVPLAEAVGVQRLVDPQGELVRTARGLGITLG